MTTKPTRRKKKAIARTVPIGEGASYKAGRLKKNGTLKRGFKFTDEGSNRVPVETIATGTPRLKRKGRVLGGVTKSGTGQTIYKNRSL